MLTVKRIRTGMRGIPSEYLVLDGEKKVGMLEKYQDTATETHPWKALLGIGYGQRWLGAFYGPSGKQDAVQAIQSNLQQTGK
jgi:hypothetical protein